MEERFLESAEALSNLVTDSGINLCSKQAIPSVDLKPEQYKRLDCETCGDDLPLFRLQKGRTLCTPCQSAKESPRRR